MRKSKLFASVLAAAAGLIGVASTATDAGSLTPRARTNSTRVEAQNDTKTPVTAPVSNAQVQNLRAGATIVPLSIPRVFAAPRWAWVGRKVGGRFDFYCRRVGA